MDSITPEERSVDITEWLRVGVDNGFISPPVCMTHDDFYTVDEMEEIYLEGGDPCILGMRLLKDIPWFVYDDK